MKLLIFTYCIIQMTLFGQLAQAKFSQMPTSPSTSAPLSISNDITDTLLSSPYSVTATHLKGLSQEDGDAVRVLNEFYKTSPFEDPTFGEILGAYRMNSQKVASVEIIALCLLVGGVAYVKGRRDGKKSMAGDYAQGVDDGIMVATPYQRACDKKTSYLFNRLKEDSRLASKNPERQTVVN